MDMNGFTGVRHKPNLNPNNEVFRQVKGLKLRNESNQKNENNPNLNPIIEK